MYVFSSFTQTGIIHDSINANNTRLGSKEESEKCGCSNITAQFGNQKEASCWRWQDEGQKKIVARKALKVKPNLGRAGGSKEHNAKKKTAATLPVEEVKEDDDDNDEEDVGASAVDDDDDDDHDDDEFYVEDYNKEDEDNSADSAPDPIVESEGEEDESSDDKEIPRTPDRRGTQTASFYKQNLEKMNSRMNKGGGKGGGLAKKPRLSRVGDPTDCQTASKSARPSESSGVDLDQMQLVHAYT
jgi:hypothetical protein